MTKLFVKSVYVTVTTTSSTEFTSTRIYIGTISPKIIEVIFYQHKFSWSFGNYMVRNNEVIERYVNLISITFTFVSILPFIDQRFKTYQFQSPQVIKCVVAPRISKELILNSFMSTFESNKIYSSIRKLWLTF